MKLFKYIVGIIGMFAITAFSSCSNDDYLLSGQEDMSISFHPTLNGELYTRGIGNAEGVNQIKVIVYEGTESLSRILTHIEDWTVAQRNGITLSLIKGYSYKILFWVENKENTAYTLTDNGNITVNYTDYVNGGFAKMEEMDAFYATKAITVDPTTNHSQVIELSRPLAQLNFVDKTTKPEVGTHLVKVKFHSIPTSFNPFTGKVDVADNNDICFTFSDFPNETLSIEETDCHYVASNYLFASSINPIKLPATIELQDVGNLFFKTFKFEGENKIVLEENKKTNVIGNLLP